MEKNIGLSNSLDFLNSQIKRDKAVGSMLFSGDKEIDRLGHALNFSRSIMCSAKNNKPCGECSSCLMTMKNSHPDVLILDKDETIKIEDVRIIKKELSLKPYLGKNKMAIINNAENMTVEAANAFLKVLEEPSESVIIILVTTDPSLLLPTIVSRTQVINFGLVLGKNGSINFKKSIESGALEELFNSFDSKSNVEVSNFLNETEIHLRSRLIESLDNRKEEDYFIKLLIRLAETREYLSSGVSSKVATENLLINFI